VSYALVTADVAMWTFVSLFIFAVGCTAIIIWTDKKDR
tara:strand:+ start:16803 stop:16916 length:114 start_codon:yes stop_codon:yes gene_type:complete